MFSVVLSVVNISDSMQWSGCLRVGWCWRIQISQISIHHMKLTLTNYTISHYLHGHCSIWPFCCHQPTTSSCYRVELDLSVAEKGLTSWFHPALPSGLHCRSAVLFCISTRIWELLHSVKICLTTCCDWQLFNSSLLQCSDFGTAYITYIRLKMVLAFTLLA